MPVVGTANLLRLNSIQKYSCGFILHDMQMHILNAVPAATAQVALYVYSSAAARFTMIPGTLVAVDCSVASVAPSAIKLSRDVQIEPLIDIFIGTVFSNDTTEVRTATSHAIPILKLALSSAILPTNIDVKALTLDEVEPCPYVSYRSVAAARIL